ncbi:hypothetical protein DFP72DRAFT_1169776 [Ephemerocybe angulata]|uniref:Uncharacterized protein n=1 Tax=Ephemerocybe angulata TaxID=980116 RepID=A0A8H6I0H4_9AGAR|nr:hypothetical protein DFP72DRAFT_1169776 [Tulosesus angulatus]
MPQIAANPLVVEVTRFLNGIDKKFMRGNDSSGKEHLQTFAHFLDREDRTSCFDSILDILDYRTVPETPANRNSTSLWSNIEEAIQAARCLSAVLQMLRRGHAVPAINGFEKATLPILVDRWPGVMAWMGSILIYAARVATERNGVGMGVVRVCVSVILAVTSMAQKSNNSLGLEIVSMPCTVDNIILLFGQINPETKRYYHDPPAPNVVCTIIHVVQVYLAIDEASEAMRLRLRSVSPSTRRMTLQLQAVSGLVVDGSLRKSFDKEESTQRFSSAICTLAEKAHASQVVESDFWEHVSNATSWTPKYLLVGATHNPSAQLRKVIEGGILKCVYLCLLHLVLAEPSASDPMFQTLQIFHPFMYLSEVYLAAGGRSDVRLLKNITPSNDRAKAIWGHIHDVLERDYRVYDLGQKRKVSMCSNPKHPLDKEGHELDGYYHSLKTYSLNAYHAETWRALEDMTPWMPRINQCIRDMEENRDKILLVEARFRFNADRMIFTFMKARYNSESPDGEKYSESVLSSFSTGALKFEGPPLNPSHTLE